MSKDYCVAIQHVVVAIAVAIAVAILPFLGVLLQATSVTATNLIATPPTKRIALH